MNHSWERALSAAALVTGALAVAAPMAGASPVKRCGSVSYSNPKAPEAGGVALNDLAVSGTTCAAARTVAKYFLGHHGKAPQGWHEASKLATVDHHQVSEIIFTRGQARIVGDEAG